MLSSTDALLPSVLPAEVPLVRGEAAAGPEVRRVVGLHLNTVHRLVSYSRSKHHWFRVDIDRMNFDVRYYNYLYIYIYIYIFAITRIINQKNRVKG